jgi:hypothetical protein
MTTCTGDGAFVLLRGRGDKCNFNLMDDEVVEIDVYLNYKDWLPIGGREIRLKGTGGVNWWLR